MHKFRNYKLHTKFVWSFIVVALMAFLLGLASILSLMNMRNSDEQMYTDNTVPMADLIVMYDLLSAQRICANNMVLYREADPDFSASEAIDLTNKEADFEATFEHFKTSLNEEEEKAAYDEISGLYFGEFKTVKQALRDAYAAGDQAAMVSAIRSIDDLGASISSAMDKSLGFNVAYAAAKVASNQELYRISVIIVCAIVFVALLIALLEARFLTKLIANPIVRILEATKQAGELGDFNFSQEAIEAAKRDAQYKDEIGQTMASFTNMMYSIVAKVKLLGDIARGDLSMAVPKVSEADTMGNALEKMLDSLNDMFGGINQASNQVSAGSHQITTGAQHLAQATTEQANTVDLLSRSVGDVTEKTQANTKLAEQAANLGGTIKRNAEQGSEQMKRMTQAVREINEASSSISTVIKVIDDIAFQTNILALNAAVEAARAGEAGKGFAVVADEVRNLAGKSAEAAKDTGALIEDSVQKAELGARIAKETSSALEGIVSGINESSGIVARIAAASEEQLLAIREINSGIDQVTEVVQQNSATAEESAAASEEMNNQAAVLNDLVNRFKLRG